MNKKYNIIKNSNRSCTKSTTNRNTFQSIQVGYQKQKGEKTMKNNMRVLLAKRREKVSHVAEATGISKSTLTALYYERTKKPDIETLQKVANYLGVTIDELLTPEE
ncbi:TPA: helix-turn-helix transcriptional regulator [Streptococcus suis]|nr:helix-turn-helix transcriptional regulator [Streptococcus suis]